MSTIRSILKPLLLLLEWLIQPKAMQRSVAVQQQVDAESRQLILYQFQACPFCIKVRRTIHRLNLTIEKRNANEDPLYRQELMMGGGKWQTPCLRIEEAGQVHWLYESSAIIDYLQQRFGMRL